MSKIKTPRKGAELKRGDTVKSKTVISEIEKSMPVKLRSCRYCRGEPELTVREDVNYKGDKGYIAKVRCKSCGISVEAFAEDKRTASVMVRSYYQRGIFDA